MYKQQIDTEDFSAGDDDSDSDSLGNDFMKMSAAVDPPPRRNPTTMSLSSKLDLDLNDMPPMPSSSSNAMMDDGQFFSFGGGGGGGGNPLYESDGGDA